MKKTYQVELLNYPAALQSAVYGLSEMFALANSIAVDLPSAFEINVIDLNKLGGKETADEPGILIIPPSIEGDYYARVDPSLLELIRGYSERGVMMCSVCAGAFIFAQAGLLNGRQVTTHWMLSDQLREQYPDINVLDERILVKDGQYITAGGVSAWQDLGLELISQYMNPRIMRQVGKMLVIDTGAREQRYYKCFQPRRDHGDLMVLKAQDEMNRQLDQVITVKSLASALYVSERTLMRRFEKATGYTPNKYLQLLRIQKACEMIESGKTGLELIASDVGYQDISAFRRIFVKVMGLTPGEFRQRFA